MTPYMTFKTKISILTLLLVISIASPLSSVSASGSVLALSELRYPTSVVNPDKYEYDEADVLLKLSIESLVTLPITQQPRGNSNFVSTLKDYVTEFQVAADYGTVGLLAHNYLAGRYFFQILPGQEITLVYSGQRTERFVVTEIQEYQALVPESPSSDFIDLTTGNYLTVSQLFKNIYRNQPGYLILQTCISTQESPSWGRLFIIAEPAE